MASATPDLVARAPRVLGQHIPGKVRQRGDRFSRGRIDKASSRVLLTKRKVGNFSLKNIYQNAAVRPGINRRTDVIPEAEECREKEETS